MLLNFTTENLALDNMHKAIENELNRIGFVEGAVVKYLHDDVYMIRNVYLTTCNKVKIHVLAKRRIKNGEWAKRNTSIDFEHIKTIIPHVAYFG